MHTCGNVFRLHLPARTQEARCCAPPDLINKNTPLTSQSRSAAIGRFVFYAAATLRWMEAAAQSDRGRVRWTCDVFASQMETGGLQTLVH